MAHDGYFVKLCITKEKVLDKIDCSSVKFNTPQHKLINGMAMTTEWIGSCSDSISFVLTRDDKFIAFSTQSQETDKIIYEICILNLETKQISHKLSGGTG